MNGIAIECVDHIKFLGVMSDEKLNWKCHIEHIRSKIAKGLGVMTRVREILARDILLTLYYTLIYPHLIYCVRIWGSAKESALNKLFVLQKRGIRLCSGARFRAPSSPLFHKLSLLKLPDIYNFYTALFMYKIKHNWLPSVAITYVLFAPNYRDRDTRHSSFFKVKKFKTTVGENCIAVRGPRIWDSLPVEVQDKTNISLFKTELFLYYISMY